MNAGFISAILARMNSPDPSRPAASNFRWVICALLFFATTFNYLDRQVISYLKEYFCTPMEMDGGFSAFSGNDLNLPDFAAKINRSVSRNGRRTIHPRTSSKPPF